MAIFKVSRHDKPSEKKLIKAASIDELIEAARIKFQLTAERYKIYLEDFIEIDEDEILIEMATQTKGNLTLVIVPDGIPWRNDVSPRTTLTSSTLEDEVSSNNTSSQPTSHLARYFAKFNSELQTALRDKKALPYKLRKSLVHVIVDYMKFDLKDYKRGTAEIISKEIVKAYPETFSIKLGGDTPDIEIETLRQQIYDALNYEKASSEKKSVLPVDLNENNSIVKHKIQDEYGCVEYLPNLPIAETWETQETKKLLLIEHHDSLEAVNDNIVELMRQTYYLQRRHLHKNEDLSDFFNTWPYFCHFNIIINHANQLLGKNTEEVWNKRLNMLCKPINIYSRDMEIVKESCKNKKKSSEDGKYVREVIKKAKEYSNIQNNKIPYQEIIFDFIAKFMKEDKNFLFVFVAEELSHDDIFKHVSVINPVLVIRGTELHNSNNQYNVVIEKKFSIYVSSFIDGILLTFLLYYVLGIVYPKEIEGTLEAIQRLLLTICPPKGTKRGGNRKATVMHPKVTKFIKELQPYIAEE